MSPAPASEPNAASDDATAAERIDGRIAELGDWRGELLARGRELILAVDADIIEGWKWRGVPTWERDGMICTGETYKASVKFTFMHGAALDDATGLFNASLEGNTRRAIDLFEGDTLDAEAFTGLVRQAIELNQAKRGAKKR